MIVIVIVVVDSSFFQLSMKQPAAMVLLTIGTCNFNNRYLLAVAREDSAAMKRYKGVTMPRLQPAKTQPAKGESAAMNGTVATTANAVSTQAKVKKSTHE